MAETRVYLADSTTWYKNLDTNSDLEDIMECAETQGTVYSLQGFEKAFNEGTLDVDLSDTNVILKFVTVSN